VVMETQYGMKD